jgi:hypothetical protein
MKRTFVVALAVLLVVTLIEAFKVVTPNATLADGSDPMPLCRNKKPLQCGQAKP